MILSEKDPFDIIYRSDKPILKPELPEEQIGVVDDVVFPTGIDFTQIDSDSSFSNRVK